MRKEYTKILKVKFKELMDCMFEPDMQYSVSYSKQLTNAAVYCTDTFQDVSAFVVLIYGTSHNEFTLDAGWMQLGHLPDTDYRGEPKDKLGQQAACFRMSRLWSPLDPWWVIEPTDSIVELIARGYQPRNHNEFLPNMDLQLQDVHRKFGEYLVPFLNTLFQYRDWNFQFKLLK